jgi:hypothetical protein
MTEPNDDAPGEPAGPEPASAPASEVFPDEPTAPPPAPVAVERDLREAVGVAARPRPPTPARDDDDDDDGQPAKKKGRGGLILAIALLVGGAVATLVLLGQSNGARLVFQCEKDRITAQEGRGFPPWGTRGRPGAAWRPIAIGPAAECETRETTDLGDLEDWFRAALIEQAQLKLTAKRVVDVDAAEAELEQALLLARDPDRKDQRKEIERLLGDVDYWRGRAEVEEAVAKLDAAVERFDAAADRRPRHASDPAAWAELLRGLALDLRAGPGGIRRGVTADPATEPPSRDVPAGVALPVEEPVPVAPDPAGTPVDAGVPQGGVLL